jgi:hypothetical protein
VGPLALVVVSFIAFNLFGDNRKADSPPSTPPSGTHVGSHGGSSSAPANAPDGQRKAIPVPSIPADPCAAEVAVAEREVSAARVAAGHWREHVQARTALLDGRISQATTKAIWKRTRLAGPGDIRRLAAATAAYQPVRGGCANAPGAAGKACRQRLTALADAVVAGQAVARDWQAHLAMMATHKAGGMDDQHAQTMWVAAWHAAPANLTAFADADATVARTASCRPG